MAAVWHAAKGVRGCGATFLKPHMHQQVRQRCITEVMRPCIHLLACNARAEHGTCTAMRPRRVTHARVGRPGANIGST